MPLRPLPGRGESGCSVLTSNIIKLAIENAEVGAISKEQLRIKLIDFIDQQHGAEAGANATRLGTWQLVEMFRREHGGAA